jgi:hypothetical protein
MEPPESRRPLSAAKQLLHLRTNALSAGQGELGPGMLDWRFAVTPSPLSRTYQARLVYIEGQPPYLFIDEPDLVLIADGKSLPHVYSQKPVRLCLYLPGADEFLPWMRLDTTVVPWTALWLYYFEEWLATGEWHGEGTHPSEQRKSRNERRMLRHAGSEMRALEMARSSRHARQY